MVRWLASSRISSIDKEWPMISVASIWRPGHIAIPEQFELRVLRNWTDCDQREQPLQDILEVYLLGPAEPPVRYIVKQSLDETGWCESVPDGPVLDHRIPQILENPHGRLEPPLGVLMLLGTVVAVSLGEIFDSGPAVC
jgi:hypothetical protein